MRISREELLGASTRLDIIGKYTPKHYDTVDVRELIGNAPATDILWMAGVKLGRETMLRFALDCALLHIELIGPYVSDIQYNMIYSFLRDPNTYDAKTVRDAVLEIVRSSRDTEYVANSILYAVRCYYEPREYEHHNVCRAATMAASVNDKKVTELLRKLLDTAEN